MVVILEFSIELQHFYFLSTLTLRRDVFLKEAPASENNVPEFNNLLQENLSCASSLSCFFNWSQKIIIIRVVIYGDIKWCVDSIYIFRSCCSLQTSLWCLLIGFAPSSRTEMSFCHSPNILTLMNLARWGCLLFIAQLKINKKLHTNRIVGKEKPLSSHPPSLHIPELFKSISVHFNYRHVFKTISSFWAALSSLRKAQWWTADGNMANGNFVNFIRHHRIYCFTLAPIFFQIILHTELQ